MPQRRVQSEPINLYHYPRATRHGLTGTKAQMYRDIQSQITRAAMELSPSPRGLPRMYRGHILTKPKVNTGKEFLDGFGAWSQFCRDKHNDCTGITFKITGPLDRAILRTPWLVKLFEIRKELQPTVTPPQRPVIPPLQQDRSPLDVSNPVLVVGWVADLDEPAHITLFPRTDNGQMYLRLDDFETLLRCKGFNSDVELYLHGFGRWKLWPLSQPIPISGRDKIVLLRAWGVTHLEGWASYGFE
ncbi:hypothetical protein C8J57DRAFT_1247745 [Mycena rebaudengoi]|nr:hypothetical protein C8J57DRAFT_1247745 [Mycena rebaudengoi]